MRRGAVAAVVAAGVPDADVAAMVASPRCAVDPPLLVVAVEAEAVVGVFLDDPQAASRLAAPAAAAVPSTMRRVTRDPSTELPCSGSTTLFLLLRKPRTLHGELRQPC